MATSCGLDLVSRRSGTSILGEHMLRGGRDIEVVAFRYNGIAGLAMLPYFASVLNRG